ncbi:18034_t:CDS:2, partial [Cetraspora pellucida]
QNQNDAVDKLKNGDNSSKNDNISDPIINHCIDTNFKSLEDQELIQKSFTPKINQNISKEPISQTQSIISSEIKIPYNQKVEQGLICELSIFFNKTSLSNSISNKQILENMLDRDDLTPGSASHLVYLFDKAKKIGQKEILYWYYYSEEFKKKVSDIILKNEINDQMARIQIYNEMKPFLPGIKRVYLCKKTQKARNIYILFKKIGIDKIKQVTYSADAISSLTDIQIQNIIKLFSEKTECKK